MGNYSHISRSVSCKWLSRLIRILIVKLLRFNNKKKYHCFCLPTKYVRGQERRDALFSTFSSFKAWNIFLLVTCTRTQSFLQVFFTLCVTSNSLGMLLFLFKNCIFLQKPWNMYYVHILRLCKYLYFFFNAVFVS